MPFPPFALRNFVEDFEKYDNAEDESDGDPPFFFEQIGKVQNELSDAWQRLSFHKFGKDFFEVRDDENHQTCNCKTGNRENDAGINHGGFDFACDFCGFFHE